MANKRSVLSLVVGATSPDNQTAPFRSKNLNLSARIDSRAPFTHAERMPWRIDNARLPFFRLLRKEFIVPFGHFPRPPTPLFPFSPSFPRQIPHRRRYTRGKYKDRSIHLGIFRRSGQIRFPFLAFRSRCTRGFARRHSRVQRNERGRGDAAIKSGRGIITIGRGYL